MNKPLGSGRKILTHSFLIITLLLFLLIAILPSIPSAYAYANSFDGVGACYSVTSGNSCTMRLGGGSAPVNNNAGYDMCIGGCPPIGSLILIVTVTDGSNVPITISGISATQIYSQKSFASSSEAVFTQIFESFTTSTSDTNFIITSGAYGYVASYFTFDTGFTSLVGEGTVICADTSSNCEIPLKITSIPDINNAMEFSTWSASVGTFSTGGGSLDYGNSAQPGGEDTGMTTNGGVSSCPIYGGCGEISYYAFNIGGSYPSSITATPGSDLHSQILDVLMFQSPSSPPSTVIVPPSIYSLNYWLYPILFLGLYDGFFLGEGLVAKVSTKGLTYLLIGGFVIGSFLAIIMGMIDYELPIISLIGFFIYIFRIKS